MAGHNKGGRRMTNIVVLGTQWGDEGKGKIVDALAQEERFRAVVRYQGGNNAGHTVVVGGERYAFHLLPSGILSPSKDCVIGAGVVLNPQVLCEELQQIASRLGQQHARLWISEKAHLVMPWHVLRDRITGGTVGTTGRGIGPAYSDGVARRGIRWADTRYPGRFALRVEEEAMWNRQLIAAMLDHWHIPGEQREQLQLHEALDAATVVAGYWTCIEEIKSNPLVRSGDVSAFLDGLLSQGQALLFEGAQATLLDIAHGTYPFVTSSHPTVGGVYVGTGCRPRELHVLGVAKAYTTRVGAGPFPTELEDEVSERLREVGHEYGTTTGRPRRCGWLDLTVLRYARRVNGLDALALTKLDVLTGIHPLRVATRYCVGGDSVAFFTVHDADVEHAGVVYEECAGWDQDITGVTRFADLPGPARQYVLRIEDEVGVPVTMVGVGPGRSQLIRR